MMRRIIHIFMIVSFITLSQLHATPRQGGIGLLYVHSAQLLQQGHLQFYTGTRYFGKVASVGSERAYALWNVQGYMSLNLGISSHIELAFSPIFYQDTNNDKGNILEGQANAMDDLFLSVKLGSFGAMESPFLFGAMLGVRIPTAKTHNIIYEPYSAGKLEVAATGIVSYFNNTIFPDENWSIHGNLGYLYHNDVGENLTDDPTDPVPQVISSEILLGVGLKYPAGTFDFSGEINMRTFLNDPPVTAYSREYVSYLTAGVYYKPYTWITFEMGVDLKLLSEKDQSDYVNTALPAPPLDFPNYPSWRGILGVKLSILPTSLFQTSEKALLEERALERNTIIEQMMEGRQDTEDAESELERIRAERESIEEELKRLRKLLENEQNGSD